MKNGVLCLASEMQRPIVCPVDNHCVLQLIDGRQGIGQDGPPCEQAVPGSSGDLMKTVQQRWNK